MNTRSSITGGRAAVAFGVLLAVLAMGGPATASGASGEPMAGGIGLRVVESRVDRVDPSTLGRIVEHAAPGERVERHVEVSNTTAGTVRVELAADAAPVDDVGQSLTDADDDGDELTGWTTVSPATVDLPPGGSAVVTVLIAVPADASPGARDGAVWAAVRSDAGAGEVTAVHRVGIRTEVVVGPGGPPANEFTVGELRVERSPGGHLAVVGTVHNTGGRALDLSGSLRLSTGPAGLAAGPFAAAPVGVVAAGGTARVAVPISAELAPGDWQAELTLRTAGRERAASAPITIPGRVVAASAGPGADHAWSARVLVGLGVACVALALAALLLAISLRRQTTAGRRRPVPVQRSGPTTPRRRRRVWSGAWSAALVVTLLGAGIVLVASPAAAAPPTVPLGAAESFSVLSGFGITSTGPTQVSANLGANTEVSVVGFPPGVIHGQRHVGDAASTAALADLGVAIANASSRVADVQIAGDLIGMTFGPGVYHGGAAVALTGTMTLDGGGDPEAVFIFQLGAAFNTAAATNVRLVNGASANHVFWQVTGATVIGALASFSGTVLTTAAITVGAGATVTGRTLSTGGGITLASNVVTTPPIVTIDGGPAVSTDDPTPTITGTSDAPAGTIVTVTVAGQVHPVPIAAGAWNLTAAAIPDGSYEVLASVTGPAGNSSTASQVLTIGGMTSVPLGAAGTFSLLSGFGVTNTGSTVVSGDLGAVTAAAVVGFPPGVVTGAVHAGDPTSALALQDLQLAYDDAAGRAPDALLAGDLGGRTITPGVYRATAALGITGILTLDGGNDPNAVFIFQVGAALGPAANSRIELINGATSSRVFWQVLGATTIGASASFVGTVMSPAAITVGALATLTGRAMSTGGTITLAANPVSTPDAAAGTLSINVPGVPVHLGTYQGGTGQTITGRLEIVGVDDTRSGSATTGWVASVSSTAFTTGGGAPIPATGISYSAGAIAQIRGHVQYAVAARSNLTTAGPIVAASGASGENHAATSWTPSISVLVPASAVAGVYTATVTHSVI